jgi:hypothetical protein
MLSIILLSVVMLSVVAPWAEPGKGVLPTIKLLTFGILEIYLAGPAARASNLGQIQ